MSLCECHNAECRYAECHCAECHYAECHYAECHYAECRSAQQCGHIRDTQNLRYIMSNPVAFEVNLDQGSLTTEGDGSVQLTSLY